MSRRYWLSLFAAIGLTLAAQVQAQGIGHDAGSKSRPAEREAKPKADTPPSLPVATQNDIHRVARALEAANDRKPSSTDERNAKAQEKVADWTPWLFVLGVAELFVTAGGVWLVYHTLVHTRRAAEAARDAVIEAKEATKVARDIGEAQVRAYLHCEGAQFMIADNYITCWPVMRNTGQSPAKKINMEGTFKSLGPGLGDRHESEITTGSCPPISAGQSDNGMLMGIALGNFPLGEILEGSRQFSVDAVVTWEDVFGKEGAICVTLHQADGSTVAGEGSHRRRNGMMSVLNRSPLTEEELREDMEDEAAWDAEGQEHGQNET